MEESRNPVSQGTKPQGAIAGIGDLSGVGLRAAQHAARLLREHAGTADSPITNLWPAIGAGRRGMVGLPHMVNLFIALACSPGRPSDGPRLVEEFRQLASRSMTFRQERDGTFSEMVGAVPMPPLSDLVDAWVESLVHPSQPRHAWFQATNHRPEVRIILTVPMTAEVTFRAGDSGGSFNRIFYSVAGTLPGLDVPALQPSKLHRLEVCFGLDEMNALAGIARAAYSPPDDLLTKSAAPGRADEATAAPETTKASGTGIHEGLQSERSASRAYPALTQTAPLKKAQSIEKQGSNQRASVHFLREPQVCHQSTTARTHHRDATYWTAAPSPPS